MSLASINGTTATRARLRIPSWGRWWADVELAGDVTLSGSVTVTIADVGHVGTVVLGGPSNGRSGYRIVGGAGGWGASVAAKSYANDAGVKKTTVANDAATAAGETIVTTGLTGRVGPSYVRQSGPAAYVLDYVAPRSWYVDAAGTTRFGARSSATIATSAARVRVDPGAGVIVLATQEIAALVPGASVDGLTALDVVYDVTPEDGLRVTLYGAPWGVSRRVEALRRLIRSLLPEYRYHGRYEYRVVVQDGERLALQPVLSSLGLPDLRRVKVRPGVPGAKATHTLGSLVEVAFVNADPARPVVVSFDDAESSSFLPTKLDLDALAVSVGSSSLSTTLGPAPQLGVARLTDAVQAGPFVGGITFASTTVKAGL